MSSTTKGSDTKRKSESRMGTLSKLYLVAYNVAQSAGWGYILFNTLNVVSYAKSAVGVWDKCGNSLLLFQSLAVLEVLHCIIGLVPSNVLFTAMQVASRVYQAWAVVYSVPEIQNSPTVALLLFAWSLTEVVRYSFYFTNLIGLHSKILTWCRYSFFLCLYPTGVIAEVGNILQSLSTIKEKQMFYVTLPNPANISINYYYVCIAIISSYIPFFPVLFNHMRRQRAKVLGGHIKAH